MGAGASKNGGEAANFCEYIQKEENVDDVDDTDVQPYVRTMYLNQPWQGTPRLDMKDSFVHDGETHE